MDKELRIEKGLMSLGNSFGFIIPSEWLEHLGWKTGDRFYVELHKPQPGDGKIIIVKKDK
jgi:bifunctional DNA-binding transcriptional regulator/antitoxin component of YhaV-PrlF toxin-antitoxin module